MADNTEKVGKTKRRTIEDVGRDEPGLQEFLDSRDTKKESSLRQYTRMIGMIRNRSPKPLLELTPAEAVRLKGELKQTESGPLYCAILRMFYEQHERPDLKKVFKLHAKSRTIQKDDIPTDDEVNAMIAAAGSLKDRALVGALFECGVRISELLAVRLKDVEIVDSPENHGRRLVRIWFRRSKVEGEQHQFTLVDSSPLVVAWLDAYPLPKEHGEAPLFPSSASQNYGEFMDAGGVRRRLKEIARKAGASADRVAAIHPHSARHYAATRMLRSGMTEQMVKRSLGWAPNSTMLGRYSHLIAKDSENAYLRSKGLNVSDVSDVKPFVSPTADVPAMASAPERYVDAGEIDRLVQVKVEAQVKAILSQVVGNLGGSILDREPTEAQKRRLMDSGKPFIVVKDAHSEESS